MGEAPADGKLVLTSDQANLAAARRITDEYVCAGCDWADRSAVLLVVSELLSNALLHGGGWWRLTVAAAPGQLRIEVEDRVNAVPEVREANAGGAPGGMGLHIVTKLVTSFEAAVHPTGTGKTIRALWSRPGLSMYRTA